MIRTTNENNQAMQDIWVLWSRFMSDEISQKLNWVGNVYVVYTNYEHDFSQGMYDTYIWYENNSAEWFNNISIDIPKFEIFEYQYTWPSDIAQAWQKIWSDPILNSKRAYTFDVEEYDFTTWRFVIYIAIK